MARGRCRTAAWKPEPGMNPGQARDHQGSAGTGRRYHSWMKPDASLPLDGQRVLELAARSMFDLFANASEGMLLVDRNARVVWINDQYRRFLPALGYEREED